MWRLGFDNASVDNDCLLRYYVHTTVLMWHFRRHVGAALIRAYTVSSVLTVYLVISSKVHGLVRRSSSELLALKFDVLKIFAFQLDVDQSLDKRFVSRIWDFELPIVLVTTTKVVPIGGGETLGGSCFNFRFLPSPTAFGTNCIAKNCTVKKYMERCPIR